MRLVNVQYWSGKSKKESLILLIEIDEHGQLVGLRSDKMGNTDIQTVLARLAKLNKMDADKVKGYLDQIVPSYNSALTTLKKGRYEIIQEHTL